MPEKIVPQIVGKQIVANVTEALMTSGSLMKVESIAECSL